MEEFLAGIGIALWSSVKFLFGPPAAVPLLGSAFKAIVYCVPGGWFGVSVFYFSSNFFMTRAAEKRRVKMAKLAAEGKPYKKKAFTRFNKFLVGIKKKPLGLYFVAASLIVVSIPVSSIIAAKFYGGQKKTPLVLYLSVLFWGVVLSVSTAISLGYPLY